MPNYGYQDTYRAMAGHKVGSTHRCITRIAGGGQVHKVTMAVTTATQGATYEFKVTTPLGEERTITKVAVGANATDIGSELASAANGDLRVGAAIIVTANAGTLTFEGLTPGESFTVTESDAKLGTPSTTQSAAKAGAIPFGRGVVRVADKTGQVELPDNANAGAKVVTVTPSTPTNNEIHKVIITADFNGDGKTESVPFVLQDAAITAKRLVEGLAAAINAYCPTNTIEATEDDSVLTLTGEVEGFDFEVSAVVTDDGGGAATGSLAVATTTALTKLAFLGVSAHSHQLADEDNDGEAVWPAHKGLEVVNEGLIFVELEDGQTPAMDAAVYLRMEATGSEKLGTWRTDSDGGDAMRIDRARWAETVQIPFGAVTGLDGKRLGLLRLLER